MKNRQSDFKTLFGGKDFFFYNEENRAPSLIESLGGDSALPGVDSTHGHHKLLDYRSICRCSPPRAAFDKHKLASRPGSAPFPPLITYVFISTAVFSCCLVPSGGRAAPFINTGNSSDSVLIERRDERWGGRLEETDRDVH